MTRTYLPAITPLKKFLIFLGFHETFCTTKTFFSMEITANVG